MNYIKELNAFRDWLLINELTTGEIALWYTLMSINNMAGWKEWFTAPNSTLQLLTGLSKQGLDNARNKLVQKKLIEYKKGTRNSAGLYKMNSLVNFIDQKFDQTDDQHLTNSLTNSVPGSRPYLNININETKTSSSGSSNAREGELFRLFEENFLITPNDIQMRKLFNYLDDGLEIELIEKAIEITRTNGKSINYFWGVLNKLLEQGIKTLDAYEYHASFRKRPKQKNGSINKIPRAFQSLKEWAEGE